MRARFSLPPVLLVGIALAAVASACERDAASTSSVATCVLVRVDDDGALLAQSPVRADDVETRCIDDTWLVTPPEDDRARELDAVMRMDTCTPTLAALSNAFAAASILR